MSEKINEIINGRKTFFICPDRQLIPPSYLEDYLSLGYECYFIDNDKTLPIDLKIDIILGIFNDAILFFCIDYPVQGMSWAKLINTMQQKYGASAKLGVLYNKRKTEEEKLNLERLYLFNIGIQCGCIQLEYQKKNNFALIEKVLVANQAKGRRKNVRILCSDYCNYALQTKFGRITGKINDISLTHFSVTLHKGELPLQLYEKAHDIQITSSGLLFRSDATLFLSRETDEGILHIFMFIAKDGQNGLDPRNHQMLLPKMYEILSLNMTELLDKLFKTAKKSNNLIQDN